MSEKKIVPSCKQTAPATASLKQGSACTFSKTKNLYKIESGARNSTHLQLEIKKQSSDIDKLYIDIIHSTQQNTRKENRIKAICPIHKNGSMKYPLQGTFCTSHSSKNISKVNIEESNNKIRVKLEKGFFTTKKQNSKLCLNLSFSCNEKCNQFKGSSSNILTRTYIYRKEKRRKRHLGENPILIRRIAYQSTTTKRQTTSKNHY